MVYEPVTPKKMSQTKVEIYHRKRFCRPTINDLFCQQHTSPMSVTIKSNMSLGSLPYRHWPQSSLHISNNIKQTRDTFKDKLSANSQSGQKTCQILPFMANSSHYSESCLYKLNVKS